MRVSVVIPMRDEQSHIGDLLDSLARQSRPADQIVVVDAGSTDGSAAIVEEYGSRGMPVHLVRTGPALPGRARNIGIEAAQNEIIALTDAGMTLEEDWLESITAPFEHDEHTEVVFGACDYHAKNLFERCVAIATTKRRKNSRGRKVIFPTIASLALSRSVWKTHGSLREDLRAGEDRLFLEELRECGARAVNADHAVSLWRPWESPHEVMSLSLKYGVCDGFLLRKPLRHIRQTFLILLFAVAVVMSFRQVHWIPIAAAVAVFNTLVACARNMRDFLVTVAKRPWAFGILMFVTFASYVAGTIGFAAGLIKRFTATPAAKTTAAGQENAA